MKVLHDFYSKVSLSSYFFENMKKDVCHNFDLYVDVCFVLNIFLPIRFFSKRLLTERERERENWIRILIHHFHSFRRCQVNLYAFE